MTDYTELKERLQEEAEFFQANRRSGEKSSTEPLLTESLAAITALKARVTELEGALRELDRLRHGCAPDELGAIIGKDVAAFVVRYRAALGTKDNG